jgi:Tyrosine phosphatase family
MRLRIRAGSARIPKGAARVHWTLGQLPCLHACVLIPADGRSVRVYQVNTQYGSIEKYFDKGLGIDRAGQQKLRDRFLRTNK